MKNVRWRTIALQLRALLLPLLATYSLSVYAGTTAGGAVQGTLFAPGGVPVTSSSVNFKLQVMDKSGTCVLYEESHNGVNLSTTNGDFSFDLGTGTSASNKINGTSILDASVFRNDASLPAFTGCPTGVTLTSGDERLLRVQFDVGSGLTTLSPDMKVQGGAYSAVAETLQGKTPSDFVTTQGTAAGNLQQTNVEYAFSLTNWQRLKDLIDGVSSAYLPTAGTGAFDFGNRVITGVSTPGTTADAVNKGYADAYIGGKATDLTSVGAGFGNGRTLVWDQVQNKWVTGIASDSTKLPLAGGTMAGNITMGGYDLLNVGNIVQGVQKTHTLGRFTSLEEATLVGTLGTGSIGMSWYNTDLKTYKIWDGSNAITQAYLSSVGTSPGTLNSAWFPATGVSAGTYGGAATVPVFTVGADGRLTAAYGTAISGVTPGGLAGGDLTGSYPNPAIAALAVTTGKINDNAITAAKIKSSGVAINRLIATDPVTPNTLTYFECPINDQIMTWTSNGWDCTTVAALSPVKTVAGRTPDAAGNVALTAYDITGIESAATKDFGTAPGDLVELDGAGKIPTSLLPAGSGTITAVTAVAPLQGGGTSGNVTVSIDVGTGANQVVRLNGSSQIPAVDGSLLTGVNASKIGTRTVTSSAPSPNQVLTWNGSQWEPMSASSSLSWPLTATPGTTPSTAPSYSFASDTDTGFFSPGVGTASFATNGTARLTIDSAGQVGVGTSAPSAKFQIVESTNGTPTIFAGSSVTWYGGELRIDNDQTDSTHLFTWGSTYAARSALQRNTELQADNSLYLTAGTNNASGAMYFMTGGSTPGTNNRMTISSDGNVGIGTTAPGSAALEVVGTGANNSALIVPRLTTALRPAGANGMVRYNTNTNKFEFFENNAWVNYGTGSGAAGATFPLLASPGTTPSTAPSYSFASDSDTGFFSPGVGTAALATNGTARLTVDSSGNVGIGTTNPTDALHVVRSGVAFVNVQSTGSNGAGFTAASTSGNNTYNGFYSGGAASGSRQKYIGNMGGYLAFGQSDDSWTTNDDQMVILTSGNVGIGTSTPGSAVLELQGTGANNSALIVPRLTTALRPAGTNGMIRYNTNTNKFEFFENNAWVNYGTGSGAAGATFPLLASPGTTPSTAPSYSFASDSDTGFFSPGAGTAALATNGTTRMTLTSTGDLGIGTSAPNDTVSIVKSHDGDTVLSITNLDPGSSITSAFNAVTPDGDIAFGANRGGGFVWSTLNNAPIRFATEDDEKMRLDPSGKLGIGTTSPGSVALEVVGTGANNSAILIPRNTTALRPAGANGMVRYNTNTNKFEFFENNAWVNYGTGASGSTSFPLLASPGTTPSTAPSYSFNNDSDTGLYSPGAGTASLATNGTSRMTVDSTGNVGIGTASPSSLLDISKSQAAITGVSISNASTASGSRSNLWFDAGAKSMETGVMGDNTAYGNIASGEAYMLSSANSLTFWQNNTGPIRFVNNNNETMYLSGTGQVGIGTASPGSVALDVIGTGANNSAILVPRLTTALRPAGANGMIRYNTNTNKFEFFENNAWVNYGTGASGSTSFPLLASPGTTPSTAPSYAFASDSDTGFFSPGAGTAAFATNGTARMTIDSTGNIGIGTATSTEMVTVYSAAANGAGISVVTPGNGTSQETWVNFVTKSNGTSSSLGVASTKGWQAYANGDAYAAGGSPNVMGFVWVDGTAWSNPIIQMTGANKIGINLASNVLPQSTFDVSGGVAIGTYAGANAAPTNGMIVSGSVGIGTATLGSAALEVVGTGANNSAILIPRNTTALRPAGANGMIRYNTNTNKFEFFEDNAWVNYGTGSSGGSASFPLLASPGTTPSTAPSYSFTSDSDTGFFSPGAGTAAFATNGTARMTIDSRGYVGIGTTAPAGPIDVRGGSVTGATGKSLNFYAQDASSNGYDAGDIYIVPGAGTGVGGGRNGIVNIGLSTAPTLPSGTNIGSKDDTDWTDVRTYSLGLYDHELATHHRLALGYDYTVLTGVIQSVYAGSVETNMALNPNGGNVAIGTITPGSAALTVDGTTNLNSAIVVPRATTAARPGTAVNGMVRYNTNTNKFEFFENNAWVNYGTGASGSTSFPLLASPGTTPPTAPSYSFASDSDTGFYSPGVGTASLATNGTARLTVDSSGNVGIGTISPAARLDITSSSTATSGSTAGASSYLEANPAASSSVNYYNYLGSGTKTGNANNFTGTFIGGSLEGYHDGTGTVASIRGGSGNVTKNSTGVITEAIGLYSTIKNNNASGAITAGYGLFVDNFTRTGAITDSYGIYVNDSTAKNYFAGNVGIGTTTPGSVALEVVGTGANNSAILIPRNTTALRPAGANGMVRYNTNTNKFEFFENNAWVNYGTGSGGSASFPLLASPGTTPAGAPSYSFTGDSDTGFFSTGAGTASFATNGTARMTIDSTGNVGVGTAAPDDKIKIVYTGTGLAGMSVYASHNSGAAAIQLYGVDASGTFGAYPSTYGNSSLNKRVALITNADASGIVFSAPFATQDIQFSQNNIERMRIDSTGNVGIGTVPGSAALDVVGTGANNSAVLIPRNTTALRPAGANGMIRYNTNTNKFEFFENNAWVNYGTGAGGSSSFPLLASPGTTPSTAPSYSFASDSDTGFYSPGVGTAALSTNGTARLTVDSDGYVGIGTSAPSGALEVNGGTAGPSTNGTSITLQAQNGGSGNQNGGNIVLNPGSATGTGYGGQVSIGGGVTIDGGANMQVVSNNSAMTSPTGGVWFSANGLAGNAPTSAGAQYIGFQAIPLFSGANGPGAALIGVMSAPYANIIAADTFGSLIGVYGSTAFHGANASTSVVTNTIGGEFQVGVDKGKITNGYGVLVDAPFVTTGGTITNYYGLYIQTPTVATNNYAIYSAGGNNYFGGKVGVGTSTPGSAALDVVGTGANNSAILIPRNTTALRPAGDNGMIRYNTNTNKFEFFENSAWVNYGTGSGAGLVNFSESLASTGVNATTPVAVLDAVNAAANVDITIRPKGTGALTVAVADGTTTGGDKRGTYAVDLQVIRTAANQVASGPYATIPGGLSNKATANYSVVSGGFLNTASAPGAAVAGGLTNTASGTSSFAVGNNVTASGSHSIAGNAYTTADSFAQTSLGQYNQKTGSETANSWVSSDPLFVVGNGTSSSTTSNAMMILKNGNIGIGTNAPGSAALNIVGTTDLNSAIVIPRSTTALRPGTAVNGMIRYNTNTNKFEFFENNAWVNYGTGASGSASFPLLANPGTTPSTAPSYAFASDSDTGFFSPGVGTAALATNGTARLTVDSTGQVGIGVTSPAYPLDVKSTIATPTTDVVVGSYMGPGAKGVINGYATDGGGAVKDGRVRSAGSVPLALGTTNSTQAIYILDSGNVGIGTITPGSVALEINGTGANNSAVLIPRNTTALRPAGANGMIRYNTNLNYFEAFENNAWKQMITTPGAASFPLLASPGTTPSTAPSYSFTSDSDTGFYSPGAGTASLATNGTARLTVDSLGSVGIGTAAPRAALDIVMTGTRSAIIIPEDTTANRPTGVNGMIRYNGNLNQVEAFTNNRWANLIDGTASSSKGNLIAGPASDVDSLPIAGSGATGSRVTVYGAGAYSYGNSNTDVTAIGYGALASNAGGWTNTAVGSWALGSNTTGSGNVAVGTLAGANNGPNTSYSGNVFIGDYNSVGMQVGAGADNNVIIGAMAAANLSTGAHNIVIGANIDLPSATGSNQLNIGNIIYGLAINGSSSTVSSGAIGIGTSTPAARLDVYGTGAQSSILVPRDSTANRPTGVNGMIRYNTNTNKFEFFENNAWTNYGTGASGSTSFPLLASPGTTPSTAPSYAFASDSDTGFFSPGAGTAAFATNGTARMTIDSVGYVGIGTATATHPITISDNGNFEHGVSITNTNTGAGAGPAVWLGNGTTTAQFGLGSTGHTWASNLVRNRMFFYSGIATGGIVFATEDPAPIIFAIDGIENARFDSTGKLAIGTSTPGSAALDVVGTGANNSAILIPRNTTALRPAGANGMIRYNTNLNYFEAFENNAWKQMITPAGAASFPLLASPGTTPESAPSYSFTSDTDTGFFSPGAGMAAFATNGTARMTIDSVGNIGIGTTNPGSPLHIYTTSNTPFTIENITPSGYTMAGYKGTGRTFQTGVGNSSEVALGVADKYMIYDATAAAVRMVVDGSGYVGIGTTTPNRLLEVAGPIRVTAAALPGTPGTGDIAVDSGDSNKLKWYNGSSWQTANGSKLVGKLVMAGKSSCTWTSSSTSWTTLTSANSNCNSATVTGSVTSPGKYPSISIASLPAGDYEIHFNLGQMWSSSSSNDCFFRISDGTTTSGLVDIGNYGSGLVIAQFSYASAQSNITFSVQTKARGASTTCNVDNGSTDNAVEIWIKGI